MTSRFDTQTLGDIVSANYQAAAVFDRYGLDFCCGGRSPLAAACLQRNVDLAAVIGELERLDEVAIPVAPDDPVALADYVETWHHAYVRSAIPTITAHLAKVLAAHGDRHPELAAIAEHFDTVAHEMTLHMAKEERVLFPYIRALVYAVRNGAPAPPDMFGTVQNPIRMMEIEHQHAGDETAAIRRLSNGYTPPADACATFRLAYTELQEFERDLHRHVHLENNILFPKAIDLEQATVRKTRIGCESGH